MDSTSPAERRLAEQLAAALTQILTSHRPPAIPEAGRLIWTFFCDLSESRTRGMHGPDYLTDAGIEAWARLHRWPIEPRHVRLIRALDRAWMKHAGVAGHAPASSDPITPGAFDAIFS